LKRYSPLQFSRQPHSKKPPLRHQRAALTDQSIIAEQQKPRLV
jgi:hypothetical protein